jgi:hypothetical protein
MFYILYVYYMIFSPLGSVSLKNPHLYNHNYILHVFTNAPSSFGRILLYSLLLQLQFSHSFLPTNLKFDIITDNNIAFRGVCHIRQVVSGKAKLWNTGWNTPTWKFGGYLFSFTTKDKHWDFGQVLSVAHSMK